MRECDEEMASRAERGRVDLFELSTCRWSDAVKVGRVVVAMGKHQTLIPTPRSIRVNVPVASGSLCNVPQVCARAEGEPGGCGALLRLKDAT